MKLRRFTWRSVLVIAVLAVLPGSRAYGQGQPPAVWCYDAPDENRQRGCFTSCNERSDGPESLAECYESCGMPLRNTCVQACEHPYPCGDEWPEGLEGPFELKEVLHEFIPMDDGARLEVYVGLPDLPEGVRAPVVLTYSPYNNACGTGVPRNVPYCQGNPNDDGYWSDPDSTGPIGWRWATADFGMPPIRLVRAGYAVAVVSVRGTAGSDGCMDQGGDRDRRDAAEMIDWVASRPWSNGRIGMTGVSWPSYLAMLTASEAPEALKTIVVGGVLHNWYQWWTTPQGAFRTLVPAMYTTYDEYSIWPPVLTNPTGPDLALFPRWTEVVSQRACNTFVQDMLLPHLDQWTDDRNEAWWAERAAALGEITAAVFDVHGLLDVTPSGHAFQLNEMWDALAHAPKRRMTGSWGHQWPAQVFDGEPEVHLNPDWRHSEFSEIEMEWFDFWLKGIGPVPENLDRADYQDTVDGTWRQSGAWPPTNARNEVLYLAGDALSATPEPGDRHFLQVYNPLNNQNYVNYFAGNPGGMPVLCPDAGSEALDVAGIAYYSPPLAKDVVIAGNPFAYLDIVSDQPGGSLSVRLIDLAPDFTCDAANRPTGWRYIAQGAADLRFHRGNMQGQDFPVGEPTHVRVDMHYEAATVAAGHRLALTITYGDGWTGNSPAYTPRLEIVADGTPSASQVILPVVEGSTGGSVASLDYPPMPFPPE